ncbi:MAG: adenylate/guanylate cyclase domain-containing protein [Deltaproteobacteria bacterium]|nr:adenylate/guanylate cyclase domain-containing protein [Deltaproteobacteria bacterium]
MSHVKINKTLLDEKFTELEKAKKWSPRVVSKLETLLNSPDDEALFCINPIRFASEKNIKEDEAIDLFLYGAHLQLFTMNWALICPSCTGLVESFASLKGLHSEYCCNMCNLEYEVNMDDMIQINFTVDPELREIIFHHPAKLSAEDYLFKYRLRPEGQIDLGNGNMIPLRDAMKTARLFLGILAPSEKKVLDLDCKPGVLSGYNLRHDFGFTFLVTSPAITGSQNLKIVCSNGEAKPKSGTLSAGQVHLEIENITKDEHSLFIFNQEEADMKMAIQFVPFLTGKRLITHQTFRDLFRFETVSGTEGIGVKNITFLFTDLKGSTAMYDRIGDLKAYTLVQQHFDRLTKVIVAHSGSIVKTIGDAVMATFMTPSQATQAAVEMLSEIEHFNKTLKSQEIILKIGIHQGASIAVTLNDRLDYFGQTVNIAARVQSLADAEEIYMTEIVYDNIDPHLLKGFHISRVRSSLKGVQEDVNVHKVWKKK